MNTVTAESLKLLLKNRINNSHKGDYGHLLIVAGCQSMPGAAVLATSAALQSGCGLVTLHSTQRALDSASINCPSAMLSLNPGDCFSQLPAKMEKFNAICIGPGLGKAPETLSALSDILTYSKKTGIPLLLDADALNLIAENPSEMHKICEGTIMTPHSEELRRLVSGMFSAISTNICPMENSEKPYRKLPDFMASTPQKTSANTPSENDIFDLCKYSNSIIIAKGYHSHIFSNTGKIFQNTTGGPGLAKAGSGDVLAGLTSGLMARGYSSLEAALLGTWIHGKAGDLLSQLRTDESFSSFDLANNLFLAFKYLYSK